MENHPDRGNHRADVEARLAYPYLFYHFDQQQPARIFNPLFGGVLEASHDSL